MDRALALSGETLTRELVAGFHHIGLIRSEYLFRDAELYPSGTTAAPVLHRYLMDVCSLARDKPVWFRTMEVTTREANTLHGVDEFVWDEPVPLMGLRGVRRHMRHPASLDAELEVLAEVRRTHPNLGVVAPFITHPSEFAWFRDRVEKRLGASAPVASMVETPSAIFMLSDILRWGASHVIVGANDLSAFLLARARNTLRPTEASPALEVALSLVREATAAAGVTMTVAGYVSNSVMASAAQVEADFVAVHYCDLPAICGSEYALLPELDHVRAVKRKTTDAIARLDRRRQSEDQGPEYQGNASGSYVRG